MRRDEIRRVARRPAECDAEIWDERIDEDATAGRLDFLFEEADAERKKGSLRRWPPARG